MVHTKDTIEQARGFIEALTREKNISMELKFEKLCDVIARAKRLHKLYEKDCNGELTANDSDKMHNLEVEIADYFTSIKRAIKFNQDPRGYPVKILGLESYNTWGGREDGWGIG